MGTIIKKHSRVFGDRREISEDEHSLCSTQVQISCDGLPGVSASEVQSCALDQHPAVCAGPTALQHLPLRPRRPLPVETLLQGGLQKNAY